MSVETDVRFIINGSVVYDPHKLTAEFSQPDSAIVTIQNFGEEKIENLGIYIKPSSNVGPWDNPADHPPSTDYQDILTWGTESEATGIEGGMKVYDPDTSTTAQYVTKGKGSQWINRIRIDPIAIGGTAVIKIEFEVPATIDARRLFVNVVVG